MAAVIDRAGLDALVRVLAADGCTVVGPTVRDGAIVLAELGSGADLPDGWGVTVAPGSYRLRRRNDTAVFGHASGTQSWKAFLHPARRRIWSTDGTSFTTVEDRPPRYAFLGVRACDLAALAVLARVLSDGAHADDAFQRCRRGLFVVAVGCTEPGELCFCASLGTGPQPGSGYDLRLTERLAGTGPDYVVEVGSADGERILAQLPHRSAARAEVDAAGAAVRVAGERMGRSLPDVDLPALFEQSRESPVWADVADRCLTCGNCTMACPTCFCTAPEVRTVVTSGATEHAQRWASCFETDYSYVHGGSVRTTGGDKYRQWISHKLGTWQQQFDTSGCVGCGRCIAWCPVGIDITVEATRLAAVADGAGDADR